MKLEDVGIGIEHVALGYAAYSGYTSSGAQPFEDFTEYLGYVMLMAVPCVVLSYYLPFMLELFLIGNITLACYYAFMVFVRGRIFYGIYVTAWTCVLIWADFTFWQYVVTLGS